MERTTAGLRPQPPNFQSIVATNRGPLIAVAVEAHPLTPRQIQLLDAPVIDVRTVAAVRRGAHPGRDRQHDPAGRLRHAARVDRRPGDAVVLVGRDDHDALHAAELAAAVGVARIAGYLAGGMTSWREERLPVDSIQRVTVRRAARDASVQILDVRERDEWEREPHPGLALHALPRHPTGCLTVSTRRGRSRSSAPPASARRSARRLVQRFGAREVLHVVDGGVGAWGRAGYPTEH